MRIYQLRCRPSRTANLQLALDSVDELVVQVREEDSEDRRHRLRTPLPKLDQAIDEVEEPAGAVESEPFELSGDDEVVAGDHRERRRQADAGRTVEQNEIERRSAS